MGSRANKELLKNASAATTRPRHRQDFISGRHQCAAHLKSQVRCLKISGMKKENINVWVNRRLAQEFRQAAKGYFNRLGMCFGAAMLMFLEADPATQGDYLKRAFHADVDDEVEEMLKAAKAEQHRRISA